MEDIIAAPTIDFAKIVDKKEFEPGEKTVMLYGQHRRKEVVAFEVARRISKFSLLRKNSDMLAIEYPEGADYNDAYDEAKKVTENNSPKYYEIQKEYTRIITKKSDEAEILRNRTCELNSDRVVVDIHETTDMNRETIESRRNEIVFLTSLSESDLEKLNNEISKVFPDVEDLTESRSLLSLRAVGYAKTTDRVFPKNSVTVELITSGHDIYTKVANDERIYDVGTDVREKDLLRVKPDGNPNVGINREATIYARLLERVLPIVEKYYIENVLT
jgi:hypothetical protein